MIIAQISDTHIKRKAQLLHHMVNTGKYLKRAIKRLKELDPRPDLVLATGDLTESGKPKEYKRLRSILGDLDLPLYVLPGNHDNRENFRDAFWDHAYLPKRSETLCYVIESLPVRIVALDSVKPGYAGGLLDEQRLQWLVSRLREAPDTPTMIALHHPPFATGIRAMDASPFLGVEAFGEIVARNPQIERIVCGHIHRAMQVRWHGTVAVTAPSTSHQVVLELREKHPLGVTLEPPGFLLHHWTPRTGIVTHACLSDRYKMREV